MDLKRFFCNEKITGDYVTLDGDEFYHAVKVTRHKIGYKFIACDNGEYDYYCTITDISKNSLIAKIDKIDKNNVENDFSVNLYIGNNKDLDTVVQKATELGVSSITPFISEHCNVKDVNYDRLNKIVLESSKQCGRSKLIAINKIVSFSDAIISTENYKNFLFYEFEKQNRVEKKDLSGYKKINLFIGPEGGFSQHEIQLAKDKKIKICTLGKCIMRVSTAVVSACVLVNDKMVEIESENSNF